MATHTKYNLEVFQSIDELDKVAAEFIIDVAHKSIAARGRFVLSLSGGQTPQKLYALLAAPSFRIQIDWKKTFVFWGDERCVPLDDDRNNVHQAKLILLDKIDIPHGNIHIIPVNLPPAEAATGYEKEINDFFGHHPRRFDLMLLGLGENGHTASLFPGTKVIEEQAEGVREVYVEEEKIFRITMTAPLINHAHHILFMVTGEKKAGILEKVLNGPYQPDHFPAQLIKSRDGELWWFVDKPAISLLKN